MIIYQTETVTVFQSAMFQLNTTVILTDDMVFVVDPGYLPNEVEEICHYVDKVKGERPLYLFFTHSDFDHIVGYGAFPEATTIASAQFVESSLKDKQLLEAIQYDDEFYLKRPYTLSYPEIDIEIKAEGETITVGDTRIAFYEALGHNHDGLLAYFEKENILIAGDYLSDIEFPFVYYSFCEYDKTLKTLKGLLNGNGACTLITSHGTVTKDEGEILQRISDSEQYFALLEHNEDELSFKAFMKEKNYQFPTIFQKRHDDNRRLYEATKKDTV